VLAVFVLLALFGSRLLLKRAINRIVKKFREHKALDAASARTTAELDIHGRGLIDFRLFKDYTPTAMDLLIKGEIIQKADDERYFLSEKQLKKTTPKKTQ
jgi:hypothetical protein